MLRTLRPGKKKKKKNYPCLHLIPPAIPQQRDKPPPNFFNSSAVVGEKKQKQKTDREPDCLKFAEKARSQILLHIYRWYRRTEEAQEERHSHQNVLYIQFHFIKKKKGKKEA